MEVFVQKGAGKVEKAKSLDEIELADCKLLVVDLLDPSAVARHSMALRCSSARPEANPSRPALAEP